MWYRTNSSYFIIMRNQNVNPEILACDIVANLESGLESFKDIEDVLGGVGLDYYLGPLTIYD